MQAAPLASSSSPLQSVRIKTSEWKCAHTHNIDHSSNWPRHSVCTRTGPWIPFSTVVSSWIQEPQGLQPHSSCWYSPTSTLWMHVVSDLRHSVYPVTCLEILSPPVVSSTDTHTCKWVPPLNPRTYGQPSSWLSPPAPFSNHLADSLVSPVSSLHFWPFQYVFPRPLTLHIK